MGIRSPKSAACYGAAAAGGRGARVGLLLLAAAAGVIVDDGMDSRAAEPARSPLPGVESPHHHGEEEEPHAGGSELGVEGCAIAPIAPPPLRPEGGGGKIAPAANPSAPPAAAAAAACAWPMPSLSACSRSAAYVCHPRGGDTGGWSRVGWSRVGWSRLRGLARPAWLSSLGRSRAHAHARGDGCGAGGWWMHMHMGVDVHLPLEREEVPMSGGDLLLLGAQPCLRAADCRGPRLRRAEGFVK